MDIYVLSAGVFITELCVLLYLSKSITQIVSLVFLKVTKSHKVSITLMAYVFLPGVIIHELSHYLTAKITGVHVSHMEFTPQIHGNRVKLGSVSIAHTDILRRFFIGVAPILFGLGMISLLFWWYQTSVFSLPLLWKTMIVGYALFEISTTMFSSSKDLEGSVLLLIASSVVFILYFIIDKAAIFHIVIVLHALYPITKQGVMMVFFVLLLDGIIFLGGKITLSLLP